MTYDELSKTAPVVFVEFFATWCDHCRNMEPVVRDMMALLQDKVQFYQLDIDKNSEAADDEHVEGTPTFIIYKNGDEVWRWSGEIDGNTLLAKVQHYL